MKPAFAFFACQRLCIIVLRDVGASKGYGHIVSFEPDTLGGRGSNCLSGDLWQCTQLTSNNSLTDGLVFLGKIVAQMETFHCFRAEPLTLLIKHHAIDHIECFQEDMITFLDNHNMPNLDMHE